MTVRLETTLIPWGHALLTPQWGPPQGRLSCILSCGAGLCWRDPWNGWAVRQQDVEELSCAWPLPVSSGCRAASSAGTGLPHFIAAGRVQGGSRPKPARTWRCWGMRRLIWSLHAWRTQCSHKAYRAQQQQHSIQTCDSKPCSLAPAQPLGESRPPEVVITWTVRGGRSAVCHRDQD